MTDKNIFVPVGCHRSGTSLVANILHENGIVMGEDENFRPKPNNTNEKGFFENYFFRRINDKILKEHGHVVKDWNMSHLPKIETTAADTFNEMNRLIVAYNRKYRQWGFKDPRTCLTLPVWKRVLPANTKFVFIFRHPMEVAASLVARGNVETIEGGLEIWGVYNLRAYVDLHATNCVFVNYHELLQTKQIADTGILGHSIIKQSLRHHNDLKIPTEYLRLWGAILHTAKQKRNWW